MQYWKPGLISEGICNKFLEEGYTKTYLLNAIELNLKNVLLDMESVKYIFEEFGEDIWKKHAELFRKIRKWACSKFKDDMTGLSNYFKAPYPLITSGEIRYITLTESVFELYDAKRADMDKGDTFVEFCNRQYKIRYAKGSILQNVNVQKNRNSRDVAYFIRTERSRRNCSFYGVYRSFNS